ncbi:hypothetical protein HS088_TW18G01148 [Tripterygium wilfordii]|uniref:DUF4005 domain-containing protein n=1 Tax=Tripterygium wilfordii TaxID=458696 RepID=A0A7J7CE97_TRIWF|nr:hypothetical protein HS088_TW18G01148 [Tripterygium wilfordii]
MTFTLQKRGKRRWNLRKPSNNQERVIQHCEEATKSGTANADNTSATDRYAIAVAVATTAAAQAAIATARAAAEVARLAMPSSFVKQHFAAIVIQTAFRGYLARRALRALKGLVKLQALVRGNNVRKRANMTLRCMQALVRVQARVCEQRNRLSFEGSRKSSWSSISTHERRSSADWVDWDGHSQTHDKLQAMLQKTKDLALKREKALAFAFSQQIWKPSRDTYGSENELEEKPRWNGTRRNSYDKKEHIKTVEIDTNQPYSAQNAQKLQYQKQRPTSCSVASPVHRTNSNSPVNSPTISGIRATQVHSTSPRCLTHQEKNINGGALVSSSGGGSLPNYMVATASANARLRSESAPRQRPSTPEREKTMRAVRKRLHFPVPEQVNGGENLIDYNLIRSPSKKSVHEQRPNASSSCSKDNETCRSGNDFGRWLS